MQNPDIILFPMRMGSVLIVLNLKSPDLNAYREQMIVIKDSESFIDFDEPRAIKNSAFLGIPSSSFVLPPIEVFEKLNSRLGFGWFGLSWDEKTYATVLFLKFFIAAL